MCAGWVLFSMLVLICAAMLGEYNAMPGEYRSAVKVSTCNNLPPNAEHLRVHVLSHKACVRR